MEGTSLKNQIASVARIVLRNAIDILWTVVAVVSLWIGVSTLVAADSANLFGLLWGMFLIGCGALLFYLVWWE